MNLDLAAEIQDGGCSTTVNQTARIDLSRKSPFLTIWTRPRATMRAIVDTNPDLGVIPIAMVGGILQVIQFEYLASAGDGANRSGHLDNRRRAWATAWFNPLVRRGVDRRIELPLARRSGRLQGGSLGAGMVVGALAGRRSHSGSSGWRYSEGSFSSSGSPVFLPIQPLRTFWRRRRSPSWYCRSGGWCSQSRLSARYSDFRPGKPSTRCCCSSCRPFFFL